MRPFLPDLGNAAHKLRLHRVRRLAGGHARAVADPEDMRVDSNGRLTKPFIQHDIGGLSANPGERLERVAVIGNDAVMLFDQDFRQPVNILRLGVEQPNGADVVGNAVNTQRDHCLRRGGGGEQPLCRPVHPHICGLRRQHHRHQKRIGAGIGQFSLWIRKPFSQPLETGFNIGKLHLAGAFRGAHRRSALRSDGVESSGRGSRLP